MDRKFAYWRGSNRKRALAAVVARRRYKFQKGRRAYKLSKSRIGLQKYNVHSYKRWGTNDLEISTTAGTTSYTKLFTLSDTSGASELTTLYDQYKIVGVKVKVHLMNVPESYLQLGGGTLGSSTNWYPRMWYVRDYDNVDTEAVTDMKQRNNAKCVILKPNSFVSFYVRPAIRNQVYLDGVTTASSPAWNQWLDCSNSTVPHYGVKFAFDMAYSQSQTWKFRLEYCYYLKFKNAR